MCRTAMKEPLILLPTRTQIQVRFSDTDMLGHVNNQSYAAYAEVGRAHFFTSLGEDAPWFVLARMELDFRREGLLEDELHVVSFVESLGQTSMTLGQNILRGEEAIVSTRSVLVCIDRASRSKIAIPTHWQLPEDDARAHTLIFKRSEVEDV